MSELLNNGEAKKEKLKDMLKKLQEGVDEDAIKEEFKDVLRSISPLEIPLIEQELVAEGISPKEIARMCDIHVEIFRESVRGAENEIKELPSGHPLRTLYEENIEIMKDAEVLNLYASSLTRLKGEKRENVLATLKNIVKGLKLIGRTHYNREEMIDFPYLERRGLNAVPAVLWRKHDEIRSEISRLLREIERKNYEEVVKLSQDLANRLIDMVFRENNILYPTLKVLLGEGEFKAIREVDDEIGYYKVHPGDEWNSDAPKIMPYEVKDELTAEQLMNLPQHLLDEMKEKMGGIDKIKADKSELIREGDVEIEHGYMLPEEISAMLATIPVDITFIDSQDRVRFFSGGSRIFTRTESILGRPVQKCHPPKSVHIVNKILQAFKKGERDKAEFWINMGPRKIFIRYYAVRKNGEYLGTVEVTQDITEMKNIEGEKRLLDWR